MSRLLADAEKFSGVKYDIDNLADVYSAVHVIQEELDIAGTTAKEAEETISGSLSSMKGAFTNVLGKLALGEDIKPSLNALATTMKVFFADNLLPAIVNVLSALPGALLTFAIAIAPQLQKVGTELLSKIFGEEATTKITSVLSKIKDVVEKSFGQWETVFQSLKRNADLLIPVLGGLLAGFVAFKVMTSISAGITAMKNAMTLLRSGTILQTASQWLLNAAMSANPIAIVAIAIGVLIAAGIALYKNWDVVKEKASQLWGFLGSVFESGKNLLFGIVNALLSTMQLIFTSSFNAIKFVISGFWQGVQLIFTFAINFIKASVNFWLTGMKFIITNTMNAIKFVFGNIWNGILFVITTVINAIKFVISNTLSTISNFVSGIMNTIKSTMSNAWNSVKTTTSNLWDSIKNTVVNKANDLVNRVKELPSRMADGINKGKSKLVNAFKGMFNGAMTAIGKPVNAIIGGANWVLEKLGAKKIATWKVPAYERGTSGHQGGHALVNDQKGSTYKELVRLPNGQEFIPEGRNVLLPNLPKGTQVIPAMQTQQLYQYAKGTKGVGNLIAEKALDIFSFAKKPLELAKTAISKFVNTDSIKEGFAKDASKGLVTKATTQMSSFFKSKLDEVMSSFGSGESGGIDFDGLRVTSPYGMRRHPISGGQKMHTGIDYAGGRGLGHPIKSQSSGIVNFAGKMGGYGNVIRAKSGIYEYLYAHLSRTIAQVGQSVSRGQLLGLMGSTGNSTGNHVHFETRKNGQHVNPNTVMGQSGGSSSPLGTGVERWRSTVMQALSMNGLPVTGNYVNAWLRQIKTESGGNAQAVQGKIGDINNRTGDLAKGLVQVIGATFNRYKFPGHNNRMNGLDSLLAGMNYAKSRYGVTGMLNRIGKGRGYENGGIITQEHLAKVGEGNKPEAIIPLTNKSRARTLIKQTQKMMGMNDEMSVLTAILTELKKGDKSDTIVNVAELHVREEADVEKIATKLNRIRKRENKARGVFA